MAPRKQTELAAVLELAKSICTGCFEKPVVNNRATDIGADERFHHKIRNQIINLPCFDIGTDCDRSGGLKSKSTHDNGEATQQRPFGFRQQLITPVERSLHHLVSRKRGTPSMCQEPETIIKACRQFLDAKCIDSARRQFDCKCNSIESSTDFRDQGRVTVIECKIIRY